MRGGNNLKKSKEKQMRLIEFPKDKNIIKEIKI